MASKKSPDEYEGGFIQVKTTGRAKVYQGTVRDRETHRVLWRCSHIHSRPEYNARYPDNPNYVWEFSALNCGRIAYREKAKGETPQGSIGLIGDHALEFDARLDTKRVQVGQLSYAGTLELTHSGDRRLTVSIPEHASGSLILDRPKDAHLPDVSGSLLRSWVTAAWLLKGSAWGITFQDHRIPVTVDQVIEEALVDILGPLDRYDGPRRKRPTKTTVAKKPVERAAKKATRKKVKPRLRIARDESNRRVFEVLDEYEQVVASSPHRGIAAKKLRELGA